jgi:hypothetical protein
MYMAQRFHVQNDPFPSLAWATTSWNMGAAFWPLIFVPLTESSGRMPGYFVAYFIPVVSLLLWAFATKLRNPRGHSFLRGWAILVWLGQCR